MFFGTSPFESMPNKSSRPICHECDIFVDGFARELAKCHQKLIQRDMKRDANGKRHKGVNTATSETLKDYMSIYKSERNELVDGYA